MRAPLLAVLALAALPAPAAADRAEDVADGLAGAPVYVAPAREAELPPAARGRLQLEILRRDIGRIRLAVVPASWGDPGTLLGAVDVPGAAFVLAGDDAAVAGGDERAALRAFRGGGSLERRLSRVVRALAGTTGSGGESSAPQPSGTVTVPGVDGLVDTVDSTIRWTFIVVLTLVVGTFALVAFLILRRVRAEHVESDELLADLRAEAEAERTALGEDIVDLDATNAGDPAAYARALDAYDRSGTALRRARSRRRLEAARALVAHGRADAARARVGSS